MRTFKFKKSSDLSYASVIEHMEQIRTAIRWNQNLPDKERSAIMKQMSGLREQFITLSRRERFAGAADGQAEVEAISPEGVSVRKKKAASSIKQRREALLQDDFVFDGVLGDSPALIETLEICRKAAGTRLPVLIQGDSGTGKELIAKVVHANSDRAKENFVSVNCGAIPANLIESELFGHKKGAFTGASADRKGLFESANKGTVFLDEIGEMSLEGQVKLLRVLQQGEIQRVGSNSLINVDIRVVAATNKDLRKMVAEETFREDLYYRLGVIHVMVPPLRERRDELSVLIEYFMLEACRELSRPTLKLRPALYEFFETYAWPGNIRELKNAIYRIACLADDAGDLHHLPPYMLDEEPSVSTPAETTTPKRPGQIKKAAGGAAEKRFLIKGLQEVNGKVTDLAANLEMSRTYLQRLLRQHGIKSKDYKKPVEKKKSESAA